MRTEYGNPAETSLLIPQFLRKNVRLSLEIPQKFAEFFKNLQNSPEIPDKIYEKFSEN